MNQQQRQRGGLIAKAQVGCLFAAGTMLAVALIRGDVSSAVWASALLVTISSNRFRALMLGAALVTGHWVLATIAAADLILAALVRYWVPRGRHDRLDEAALAAAVAALPRAVLDRIAAEARGAVDTTVLLRAAVRADHARWGLMSMPAVPAEPPYEGGLVSGTMWTVCAAEAVLVASSFRRPDGPLDLHELAAAGCLVPYAASGQVRAINERALSAAGVSLDNVIQAVSQASRRPGGELLAIRAELAAKLGESAGTDITVWNRLRPGAGARPAVSAAPVAPAPVPRTVPPAAAPAVVPRTASTPPAAPRPTITSTGTSTGPRPQTGTAAATAAPTRPRTTARQRARAEWPDAALVLWWVVRPLATTAAVGVALATGLATGHWGRALAAATVPLVLRPAVSVTVALGGAIAAGALLPAVGVLVGLRGLAGAAALVWSARSLSDRRQAVVRLRRAVIEGYDLDAAWAELDGSLRRGDGAADEALLVLGAAWATVRLKTILRTVGQMAAGLLWGRWPSGPSLALGAGLLRLALIESVLSAIIRFLAPVVTFLVVILLLPPADRQLVGLTVPAWVGAALAALLSWSVAGGRGRLKVRTAMVVWAVAAWIASGSGILPGLGVAVATAVLVGAPLPAIERRMLGRDPRPARWPRGWRALRARQRWLAARQAVRAGNPDAARRLWGGLVTESGYGRTVAAPAWAALADLELDDGNLQESVECAQRALAATAGRADPAVAATAGRVLLAAGDRERARTLLDAAVRSRSQRRDPKVLAARATLLALENDPDQALRLIGRSSIGLLRGGRLDDLIAMEVALIAHRIGREPSDELEQRLDEFKFLRIDESLPPQARRRLATGMARGLLLQGRLQLERGASVEAEVSLRRAASDLWEPTHRTEQATARILLGVAMSRRARADALEQLSAGIDQMETVRGGLRAGEHRSQLVGRHSAVYEQAFDTLVRLQATDPTAGKVAARLSESLRRSALAETLRGERSPMAAETEALIVRIAELESTAVVPAGDELDRCREQLAALLSETFARAYVPRPVDYGRLQRRVGSAQVLSYRVHAAGPEGLRGHVVWMRRATEPVVAGFGTDSVPVLEILGLRGEASRERRMRTMSVDDAARAWADLARTLVPAGLLDELVRAGRDRPQHLVVVPDEPLSVLPWAALRLPDGRFLTEAATVQHTPTLDLLAEPDAIGSVPANDGRVVAFFDPQLVDPDERAAVTAMDGLVVATGMPDLVDRLRSGPVAGAYVCAHGDGSGLEQHVDLGDSGRLSAAVALGQPWPAWTIFASCIVGSLDITLGQEPLGLPVSCMMGGSRSVVGGVINVHQTRAGRLAAQVAARQRLGVHPAVALREAQLALLGQPVRASAPYRWAGFVCFSRELPAGARLG